jgi:hypothetical protein
MMGKLKEEFAKMLSIQNEEQQKEMGNVNFWALFI